jgi:hypothetical protein
MPQVMATAALLLAANTAIAKPINNKAKLPSSDNVRHYPNTIWSGFVTRNVTDFKAVEGRISVPKIDCKVPGSAVAFWAGYTYGNSVEQTGIDATCSSSPQITGGEKDMRMGAVKAESGAFHSTPTYNAWWMMFGVGSAGVEPLTIRAGDIVDYKVAYEGMGKYGMSVRDLTTKQHYATTQTCQPHVIGVNNGQSVMSSCDPTTVEWVVERPGASPLADFGTVRLFDNKATTATGKTYPMTHFEINHDPTTNLFFRLNMVHDQQLDKVSNPTQQGNFEATWLAAGALGQ